MRFGPTSLKVGGVLAQGLRRPKVRSDLKISQQSIAGETSYVIKIPETESLARYGEFGYELLMLCDGTRTVSEITAALNELHPESPLPEADVGEFISGVEAGTWERSLAEKNLAVLEKIRDERKKRVDRASLLYIYFSAWDPDNFLARIHPYLKWLYTPGFVLFSLLLFGLTAAIVVADYARIRQDTVEFYNFTNKTAYDLWIFWVLTLFVTAVHETGHGLTCKHFGGEVHHMGSMLMFFMPSFYTDCTDMAMFDRSSKRVWTIMAGIWIELVVCALATFIWFLAPPGSFVGDLGYKTLLLTGVSGVFINVNPLMKLDGYFVLSEYLEIENLREDAFEYLKTWVRRNLYGTLLLTAIGLVVWLVFTRDFGLKGFALAGLVSLLLAKTPLLDWMPVRKEIELTQVGERKHRIFLLFGTAATAYSLLLLTVVTLFMRNIFTSKFGDWGYLMTVGVVYLILRKKINKWIPVLKTWLVDAKEKFMVWRITRLQQVGGVALLVALFVYPPTSITVDTEFLLEPGARAEVRAPVAGRVSEVRVKEGETVAAGAVLAVLRNPDVEARAATVARERDLAERQLLAARAGGELGESQRYTNERQRLEAELAEAQRKYEGLLLRAPLGGVVTTPRVEQRVGEYLKEGDTFAVIADRHTMRARVLVRDWELEDVQANARVKLNVRTYPFRTFSGKVSGIMPAAAADRPVADPHKLERKGQELTNYFAVVLEFPNPEPEEPLQEGMTGTAKIYGKKYPIGWRVGRSAWRWVRSLVW